MTDKELINLMLNALKVAAVELDNCWGKMDNTDEDFYESQATVNNAINTAIEHRR